MKNNLKNGVIIGTLIASLGIGGGIFIANNKSSERTSIKKTEDSQNTNNTNSKIYKNQDEIYHKTKSDISINSNNNSKEIKKVNENKSTTQTKTNNSNHDSSTKTEANKSISNNTKQQSSKSKSNVASTNNNIIRCNSCEKVMDGGGRYGLCETCWQKATNDQNDYSDNYEEPVGDEWQIDPANPDRVMPQLEQSED